jgi:hypothetical protein
VLAPARNRMLRACATSRPSTASCDWWRLFAVRLGSGGGPLPSIDVADARWMNAAAASMRPCKAVLGDRSGTIVFSVHSIGPHKTPLPKGLKDQPTVRKGLTAGMAALAAITFAPIAHADSGDQASAEEAMRAVYSRITCGSPPMPMSLQSITWSRFYPASFGEGRIIDANPRLGGPFQVAFTNPRVGPAQDSPPFRAYGQWGVNLEFC